MITLPNADLAATETLDDGSTRQQVQRIVDAHALEAERKRAIHRALLQHRMEDELQRMTGMAGTPGGKPSHRLRDLLLVGSTGLLGLLLIGLLLPPM